MKSRNVIHAIFVLVFLCFAPRAVLCEEVANGERNETKKVKYTKIKGGLKNLLNFARSRKGMIKELNQETKNYQKIKKAVKKGQLEKGMNASLVKKRYGKGVITLSCDKNAEEWVYKNADETYFNAEKIYLKFSADGKLTDWREVPQKMHPSK
ncbi:MAG: hypothetical protein ISS33_02295 [Candidatus Omnitrophica bacterium]|nr:hypothetical protein [Candidatus Omnitrophota bacterium]